MLSQQILSDLGAVSLEDYLAGNPPPARAPVTPSEPADVNAVSQLHQVYQRAFRNTDGLKFEFIDHGGPKSKQCILTVTKPGGVQRSYATQPIFAKKSEAKLEAVRIAMDMGVLEFIAAEQADTHMADAMSVHSNPSQESFIDDIEQCCREWRAGRVAAHWVPFSDPKSVHKQGCALRIRLSPHVVRVYLADPIFDTYLDAKAACAKLAVSRGVLDFIKQGNGQTRPSSPIPPTPTSSSVSPVTTPWTLQAFYESLPRPFSEPFGTDDASEINAPGWLNSMIQNARGGKLILTFFFTSDGLPGLHGCLLKLDHSGEYRVSLVDARFLKRSDAKAAVCLQAISEGIGNYIRSIASEAEAKVTQTMRSFSSSLVYPALMSELSKIGTDLHPHFEYDRDRDAFGASLVVRLSPSPTPNQIRRYTVPNDYRNKADAKVGVICLAAEQGVVEFVRFRGATPPGDYVSPYTLHNYDPGMHRKRKQTMSVDDAEQGKPPKKKRKKGKRRTEVASQGEGSQPTALGQWLSFHASGDQMHGISGPGDMGLSQSVPVDDSCDPSQPGVGGGGGSGAARSAVYGAPYDARMYGSMYPAVLDPRFAAKRARVYGTHGPSDTYAGGSHLPYPFDVPPLADKRPRASSPGPSHAVRQPVEPSELEPGEVISSASSDFSESSSRNDDVKVPTNESVAKVNMNETKSEGVGVDHVTQGSIDKRKRKGKEMSPANTSTAASQDASRPGPTSMTAKSHVKGLIDYCAQYRCGTPSFHYAQNEGRFQVWIVIGKERFDLPTTYGSIEEGWQRVAKQVLLRLSKGTSGRIKGD